MREADLIIRRAVAADRRACEELLRDAFWDVYRPGCHEHYVWHVASGGHPDAVADLALVAEQGGEVAGCIMSTRAHVVDGDRRTEVLALGPVGVAPRAQRQGVAHRLIRATLERASELGFRAACLYGDPDYYPRFGFVDAERFGVTTADGDNFEDFMAAELIPGALDGVRGRLIESDLFEIDRAAVAAFDASFPARASRASRRPDLP